MASIRWFKNGKLGPKEDFVFSNENSNDVYWIIKYKYDDKFSFDGYRFWIGKIDKNGLFSIIKKIEKAHLAISKMERMVKLTNKDIINIKSDNVFITNDHRAESNLLFFYRWSQICNMLGKENIMFYK